MAFWKLARSLDGKRTRLQLQESLLADIFFTSMKDACRPRADFPPLVVVSFVTYYYLAQYIVGD
jgi:hypothetical protein